MTGTSTKGTIGFKYLPKAKWAYTRSNGKPVKYLNYPAVFDIETSSFYHGDDKTGVMYAWVFGINGRCYRGRTWEEFLTVCGAITTYYRLTPNKRLIIYVHNLAFEFQFMRKLFTWEKVFSLDRRKPLYAITDTGIEFRCSYQLTGYSLAKLGEHLHTYKVAKLVGDLDYRLIRGSETPLTEKEWGYILNDGLVVMAHIQEEIERLGSIKNIPLTTTGYVRELCRDYCMPQLDKPSRGVYREFIRSCYMDPETYTQLRKTYTGGFTHGNARWVGQVLHNVASYDFTSSYPAVMLAEKYPVGPANRVEDCTMEQLQALMKNQCVMFEATFHSLMSTTEEQYLSASRCKTLGPVVVNNGRVVFAETLVANLTGPDFDIVRKVYKWESMELSNVVWYWSDWLPTPLCRAVLDLYKAKTTLKGVEGSEVEYMNAKGMLNSCYGMCVTDPCRAEVVYSGGWSVQQPDTITAVEKHNRNSKRFLYYPWGVWITAYARRNLWSGILEMGPDYVYSDTDSIKCLNHEKHSGYFERYNTSITAKIKEHLGEVGLPVEDASPVTKNGVPKPMGVWDFEGVYKRFKTLGAKRYLTEGEHGLELTVAGVAKRPGAEYIKHLGGDAMEQFVDGLYFPPEYVTVTGEVKPGAGKLLSTYIDEPSSGVLVDYMGHEQYFYSPSAVHLEPTGYMMGISEEFNEYLESIALGVIKL